VNHTIKERASAFSPGTVRVKMRQLQDGEGGQGRIAMIDNTR
jgi:hypothetical protein